MPTRKSCFQIILITMQVGAKIIWEHPCFPQCIHILAKMAMEDRVSEEGFTLLGKYQYMWIAHFWSFDVSSVSLDCERFKAEAKEFCDAVKKEAKTEAAQYEARLLQLQQLGGASTLGQATAV
jgi:hypothetical protein